MHRIALALVLVARIAHADDTSDLDEPWTFSPGGYVQPQFRLRENSAANADEDGFRLVADLEGFELDRIDLKRLLGGNRRRVLEIAERNDDRDNGLLELEIEPGLAPEIVLPDHRSFGAVPHRQDDHRRCLILDNLDAMLGVEGLDCIMVGPDDLSQDLGVPGEMQSPVLLEAFDEIFAACRKRNKPFGLSAQSPEMAAKWYEKGATWIPYQNDAAMVLNAARAAVPQLMEIGGRS